MTRILKYGLGGVLVTAGLAALLYGGILAAFATHAGAEPYHLAGWTFCIAGVLVMGLGLKLCGVDFDWRDRY